MRKIKIAKTFVFFDDKFSLIVSAPKDQFSLLPTWKARVLEIREYQGELI